LGWLIKHLGPGWAGDQQFWMHWSQKHAQLHVYFAKLIIAGPTFD